MSRPFALIVVLALLVVGWLAACGGDDEPSAEEQAQAQVCDARDDIGQEVDRLAGLTLSTATVDELRSSLSAIADDLQTIADAQPELSDERRQEVEQATRTFATRVTQVLGDVGRSLSLDEASRELRGALSELRDAYTTSLARIDCE